MDLEAGDQCWSDEHLDCQFHHHVSGVLGFHPGLEALGHCSRKVSELCSHAKCLNCSAQSSGSGVKCCDVPSWTSHICDPHCARVRTCTLGLEVHFYRKTFRHNEDHRHDWSQFQSLLPLICEILSELRRLRKTRNQMYFKR